MKKQNQFAVLLGLVMILAFQNCGKVAFDKGEESPKPPVTEPPEKAGKACLTTDESQTGEEAKPWVVSDCQCLQDIEKSPKNSAKNHYFVLDQNIDCAVSATFNSGKGFEVIQNFSGTLDGAGYTISNLVIKNSSKAHFINLSEGTIKNINFSNLNLESQGTASLFSGDKKEQKLLDININGITLKGTNIATLFASEFLGQIKNVQISQAKLESSLDTVNSYNTKDLYHSAQMFGFVNQLGSISGNNGNAQILDSSFSGEFNNGDHVGGMVGWIFGGQILNSTANIIYSGSPTQQFVEDENKIKSFFNFGGVAQFVMGGSIENTEVSGNVNMETTKGVVENSIQAGGVAIQAVSKLVGATTVSVDILSTKSNIQFSLKNNSGVTSDFFSLVGGFVADCNFDSGVSDSFYPKIQKSQALGSIQYSGFKNDLYNSAISSFIPELSKRSPFVPLSERCDILNSEGTGAVSLIK